MAAEVLVEFERLDEEQRRYDPHPACLLYTSVYRGADHVVRRAAVFDVLVFEAARNGGPHARRDDPFDAGVDVECRADDRAREDRRTVLLGAFVALRRERQLGFGDVHGLFRGPEREYHDEMCIRDRVLPENIEPQITSIQPLRLAFSKNINQSIVCFGLLFALVEAGDAGAEGVQAAVDVAVAEVDLVDVLDRRDPLGRHGRCV